MIQNAILDVRLDGFENGVTPVFPKEIFILKEGVNVDLSFEQKNADTWNIHFVVTGKYLPITEFLTILL